MRSGRHLDTANECLGCDAGNQVAKPESDLTVPIQCQIDCPNSAPKPALKPESVPIVPIDRLSQLSATVPIQCQIDCPNSAPKPALKPESVPVVPIDWSSQQLVDCPNSVPRPAQKPESVSTASIASPQGGSPHQIVPETGGGPQRGELSARARGKWADVCRNPTVFH